MQKIVGIAGTFASGKDTLAEYLVHKYGYLHVSTGDLVREECKRRGISIHRDNLFKVATELRNKFGTGILAERAIAEYKANQSAKGLVMTGIRSIGEVEKLHQAGGLLLFTDAPIELRYRWARGRGRLEDKTTLEGFKKQEERELSHPDPSGQNIAAVRRLADIEIKNNGTLEDFKAKLEIALKADTK